MIRLFLFVVGLSVWPLYANAQSLDIGGVELSLGQSQSDVVARISKFYDLMPANSVIQKTDLKSWYLVLNRTKDFNQIGGVQFENGRLVTIQKDYLDYINNQKNFSIVYAIGSAETESRGGKKCMYHELNQNALGSLGYIHRIIKICGLYRLSFGLQASNVDSDIVAPSLVLIVSSKK